jgi:hypothetical protein
MLIRCDYEWQKENVLDKDIVYDTDIYGDLYQICMVDNFRIMIDPRRAQYQFSEKQPSTEDADVLIFGDSFLDHPRQKGIHELIADSTGLRVFYESHYLTPIYMADLVGIEKSRKRVMIMEVVERYVSTIDAYKPEPAPAESQLEDESTSDNYPVVDWASQASRTAIAFLFPKDADQSYEFLVRRGIFINRISALISTIKFDLFGYINETTPVFSKDPPMLFYHESVDSSKYSYFHYHSDEEITAIVENLKEIHDYLLENYNLEFVLFPVPNKITIAHKLVTEEPYDNFLPRFFEKMEEKELPIIKIYEEFVTSDRLLYYPNDTHWNTLGMNLAYKIVVSRLAEIRSQLANDSTLMVE